MSFEEAKYKKKDTLIEKPSIKIDTKDLLQELARKIANEYGIDISKVKELISSKTEAKLDNLKSSVGWKIETNINFEELQSVISGARNVIEKVSKEKIEVLKGNLQTTSFSPKDDFYITEKIIPKYLLKRAQDPKNISDNVLGAGIGIINSTEATIQLLYKIGEWIIQTPYHIYLIVSGKWKYEGIKRI